MVLIIDDESDIRTMLVDLFDAEGIEAHAVGPREALSTLRSLEPEVVLLDVVMPGLDGYNILRHVRSDDRLSRSFVLLLTGKSTLTDLQTGLDNGADDYVVKPFAVDELIARVKVGLNAVARN